MRTRWSVFDTAAAVLVLALFTVNVARYAFLGDDGYICFRYAQNLLDGHGLVYNVGERVEGYTTFTWVMLMALVMRLGIAPELAANAIGVACGAATLVLLVRFGKGRGMGAWAWLAPLALACNRTFTAWSTGGLETALFAFLVLASALRFLRERAAEREHDTRALGPGERPDGPRVRPFDSGSRPVDSGSRPVGSALLFAATVLTRPDGALFAGVAGASFLSDVVRRKRSARAFAAWVVPLVTIVGAHLAWRLAYYGEPLPNTFYAKVSGLWLEQSTAYLGLFARDHFLWLLAPFLVVLYVRRPVVPRLDATGSTNTTGSRMRSFGATPPRSSATAVRADATVGPDAAHCLFGAMLAAHLLYLLYVGGDRFEYRFLTPVLSFLYWLCADGLRVTTEVLVAALAPRKALVTALRCAGPLLLVGTAAVPSFVPFEPRHGINSLENMEAVADSRAEQGRFLRACVDEGLLRGDELLGVLGAGALPYYSRFPALDLHGLNDLEIARLPVEERGIVAHEKVATEEILFERKVVICETKNDLVFDEPPPMLDTGPKKRPYFEKGPLRCVALKDKYLVFMTTLDEDEFRARFGHLEIVK